MQPEPTKASSTDAPGPWARLFLSPYLNWLWLAPIFGAIVWGMNGPAAGGFQGSERATAALLAALLGPGLGRQVVAVTRPSELSLGLRLYVGLMMGLWFGLFNQLVWGPQEVGSMLLRIVVMGATFGGFMAIVLKVEERNLPYWQEETSFYQGGMRAWLVRLWPAAGWALLLGGLASGQSLLVVAMAVTALLLVAPPFRRLRPPQGLGEKVVFVAGKIVMAALILAIVWLQFGHYAR